jgi:hypothetical protein
MKAKLQDIYKPYSSFGPYGPVQHDQRFAIQQQPNITSTLKALDKEDANLEAERGELALKSDLTGIYTIGGKTHAKGGTPLNLEGGSFIFSNDPKLHINPFEKKVFEFKEGGSVGKKLNTPAKILSREIDIKHYNHSANILNDKSQTGYDKISQNSAALMLQKYQEKIGQVAYLQEQKKNFPTGIPDFSQNTAPIYAPDTKHKIEQNPQYMKKGGLTNPYATGGITTDDLYPPDKTGKWGNDIHKSRNPLTGQVSNTWNAMTDFSSPEQYAQAVGYTGNPQNIKAMQQWVGQKYPELVAKYHADPSQGGYGKPLAGTPYDGKLGVRWQAIAQGIQNPNSNIDLNTLRPGVSSVPKPETSPYVPNANIPVAKGNNPLAPNEFNRSSALPYDPSVPLSPLQKANIAYAGYNALTVPRYSPQRMNIQSPLVELERYNPQAQLNSIDNSAFQAYQNNRVSNPYGAASNNAAIFGKSLDTKQQVLGDYDNRNVGIANQQNLTNNQIEAGDLRFNTNANNQYYNQTQALNQNYDNETRFARNNVVSLYNDYESKNQELEQFLGSQRNAGKVQIGTNKDGSPIYQNMPLYALNNKGWSPKVYYTGAGSLDSLPQQSSKANDLQLVIQQLKANGIPVEGAAGSRIIAATLGKGNLQQQYTYKKGGKTTNPYI